MACHESVMLSSGYACPLLGYGTFLAFDAEQLKTAVKCAVETGYRHIDTAHVYRNEHVIGEALQELYDAGVVKREDVFITTKIDSSNFRADLVEPVLRKQMKKLNTSYLDLYLMHIPVPIKPLKGEYAESLDELEIDLDVKLEDAWRALEKCVEAGLVRSIGVSNFSIANLEKILKICTIKPAMNQIELHPVFQNKKLVTYCKSKSIVITAYSQFGRPGKPFYDGNLLENDGLVKIGAKYGKQASHVILRWLLQQDIVAIPKSVTPSRVVDNFKVWDFQLSDDDMKTIGEMDLNKRYEWLTFLKDCAKHPEYPFTPDGASC